ncbi:MAG TPA: response regulator [Acidobacteriota bacterium]|nr:response regulator [Acidobacteriota bacterium]
MATKVLLVEDDPDFRAVLALALELHGYLVRQVAGGHEALELLSTEQPDIIISDLEMNGVDGRALCKYARRNSTLAHIPFVILSAFVDPVGSSSLADLPADRCLSKLVPVSQLVRLVDDLLNGSRGGPRPGGT